MIVNHRPSILQRPLPSRQSKSNEESAEKEYEQYQNRLKALRERASRHEESLMNSLYPPQAGSTNSSVPSQGKPPSNTCSEPGPKNSAPSMDHPSSITFTDRSDAKQAASRAAAREAMQANMEMAAAKKQARELQKARERHGAAATLKSEDSWWNLGAQSERVLLVVQWIPPEHRLRGKGCKAGPHKSSSGAAAAFQWPERSIDHQSQRSAASAAPYAPYGTMVEVAPPSKYSSYRPTAPFYTEAATSSTPAPQPPTVALQAPYSLHDSPAVPEAESCRHSSWRSVPPFASDHQPPEPPRRRLLGPSNRAPEVCPYDTLSTKSTSSNSRRTPPGGYSSNPILHDPISKASNPGLSPPPAEAMTRDQSYQPWYAAHSGQRNTRGPSFDQSYTSKKPDHGGVDLEKVGGAYEHYHTPEETVGRKNMYAGRDMHGLMHPVGTPITTSKQGTTDMVQFNGHEIDGQRNMYNSSHVSEVMNADKTLLNHEMTNSKGMYNMPQYNASELVGQRQMYSGEDVFAGMHPKSERLVTNKEGLQDMPQFNHSEDFGRHKVYCSEQINAAMHPNGAVLVTNKQGRMDMPQYTADENSGRANMYSGRQVDRMLHRDTRNGMVYTPTQDIMPHSSVNVTQERHTFPCATTPSNSAHLPSHSSTQARETFRDITEFERIGKRSNFHGDTMGSLLYPDARSEPSFVSRLGQPNFRDNRELKTSGDQFQKVIGELSEKYGLS